jgi:hypothetical protein
MLHHAAASLGPRLVRMNFTAVVPCVADLQSEVRWHHQANPANLNTWICEILIRVIVVHCKELSSIALSKTQAISASPVADVGGPY